MKTNENPMWHCVEQVEILSERDKAILIASDKLDLAGQPYTQWVPKTCFRVVREEQWGGIGYVKRWFYFSNNMHLKGF